MAARHLLGPVIRRMALIDPVNYEAPHMDVGNIKSGVLILSESSGAWQRFFQTLLGLYFPRS
ncbi:hypothetical protein NUU61_004134 [Penicillium alfredii]|uniref:Uncharacterized protein n=1 Tax=Penicillium alfredii TaxID=1506179 RepID=A0A9W9KEC8_9EURO|nr:uncharacterized protein NUU61_004134 [Penicillium alfredii]KAJ5101912.1 hypothetical protein NUU61_004134 [Penicillium alfredii]